ncbi:hypothetical protein FC73_GL000342 [Fructilactobacillus fructivorans]|nr:hypothetical protein FC73_GL000342 [Fructilactobacillus fructivorans]
MEGGTSVSVVEQVSQINKEPQAVYLILGNDNYWIDTIQKKLKALIPEEERTMNFATYDMEETPLSTALDDAMSIPFFGEKRLVFVKNPYFLMGERNKSKVVHHPEELVNYLKNPPQETVLVFFAPYPKLDARKKVSKELKKQAEVIDLNQFSERETKQLIQKKIEKKKYVIDQDALNELLTRTSDDLASVMNELNKLFLYKINDKKITLDDVDSLVSKSMDQNVFDLVNYLMSGNTTKAIEFYHDLIAQKHEPIQINAILVSQFRLLLQVKILEQLGYSQGNLASALRVHPYRVKLAMRSDRKYSRKYLRNAYVDLVKIEEQLKSTSSNPELLFEMFAVKLNQSIKKEPN